MSELDRSGVRIGQSVRDLDGKDLGRVKVLYDQAFLVVKGLPLLFRQDHVLRYDEVRGERDGALVVARSDRELLELARGELPATWRVPVPPGFPSAATPAEARGVFAEVALGHAAAASIEPAEPAPVPAARPDAHEEEPVSRDDRARALVPPPPGR
jgi:hypothetical protein